MDYLPDVTGGHRCLLENVVQSLEHSFLRGVWRGEDLEAPCLLRPLTSMVAPSREREPAKSALHAHRVQTDACEIFICLTAGIAANPNAADYNTVT